MSAGLASPCACDHRGAARSRFLTGRVGHTRLHFTIQLEFPQNLVKALELSSFQIAGPRGAARLLGLNPSTLSYRLKQLGIERPK